MEPQAFDLLLALVVSLLSGYLGIGGGILMAPALLYLPPALGLPAVPMSEVTGLTITQALAACLSGGWQHARRGCLDRPLVGRVASGLVPASLAGSLLSVFLRGATLQGLLAALALLAAGLAARPGRDEGGLDGPWAIRGPRAVLLGAVVGLLCGAAGQGGSFLLVPSMIALLGVPTRVAMGSNLVLVFLASLMAFVGKCWTGQVPLRPALFVALGAVVGAHVGSLLSHRTAPRHLRWALSAIVGLIGIVLGVDALTTPCS